MEEGRKGNKARPIYSSFFGGEGKEEGKKRKGE